METKNRLGQVREISENVEETRTITFIASDNSVDRHGTVLSVHKWKMDNFNDNPIIGWQHNVYGDALCGDPSPDSIIGKGRTYIEGERLMVDVTFEDAENNPLAEKIFNKVRSGILNAVSVGFIELEEGEMGQMDLGQDPEVYYFGDVELLEISVVSIPSNPKALRKELRGQTHDALKFIYQQLGGEKRYSDIEKMTVGEILDIIEGREVEVKVNEKELPKEVTDTTIPKRKITISKKITNDLK
jgi:hypothetical protein